MGRLSGGDRAGRRLSGSHTFVAQHDDRQTLRKARHRSHCRSLSECKAWIRLKERRHQGRERQKPLLDRGAVSNPPSRRWSKFRLLGETGCRIAVEGGIIVRDRRKDKSRTTTTDRCVRAGRDR